MGELDEHDEHVGCGSGNQRYKHTRTTQSVSLVGPNHQHNRILKRETGTVETLEERLSHTIGRMLK